MKSLNQVLNSFKDEANGNSNLPKIIKNWDRNIIVTSTDNEESFTIEVKNQEIKEILPGEVEGNEEIQVHADEDVLIDIFTGNENPSEMVLDGQLQVFGSETDQIKLDAITLILWGM